MYNSTVQQPASAANGGIINLGGSQPEGDPAPGTGITYVPVGTYSVPPGRYEINYEVNVIPEVFAADSVANVCIGLSIGALINGSASYADVINVSGVGVSSPWIHGKYVYDRSITTIVSLINFSAFPVLVAPTVIDGTTLYIGRISFTKIS